MDQSSHYVERLSSAQTISAQSAGLPHKLRIDAIDIKGQMERTFLFWIQIFNGLAHDLSNPILVDMVHGVTPHSPLVHSYILIRMNISNANKNDIPGIKVRDALQPLPARQFWERYHTRHMSQWHSMIIFVVHDVRSADLPVFAIRVPIHPYNLEVRMNSQSSCYSCSSNGVIPTHRQQNFLISTRHDCSDFFMKTAQNWPQNIKIFDWVVDRRIYFSFGAWPYIAIINDLCSVDLLKHFKSTRVSDQLRPSLDTSRWPALANRCSKIGEPFDNSCPLYHQYFQLRIKYIKYLWQKFSKLKIIKYRFYLSSCQHFFYLLLIFQKLITDPKDSKKCQYCNVVDIKKSNERLSSIAQNESFRLSIFLIRSPDAQEERAQHLRCDSPAVKFCGQVVKYLLVYGSVAHQNVVPPNVLFLHFVNELLDISGYPFRSHPQRQRLFGHCLPAVLDGLQFDGLLESLTLE